MRIIVVILLSFSLATSAFAQIENPDKDGGIQGPRKQLATIVYAGLAGAILGLSTLSFYGRPQDHLSNIAVGFAVGVIGGTIYSTYSLATQPREFMTLKNPNQFHITRSPGVSFRVYEF